MRTSKQKDIREPEVRTLKIQPHVRFNRRSRTEVPLLKLCGAWLEKSGFKADQRVTVTAMDKVIVIRAEE